MAEIREVLASSPLFGELAGDELDQIVPLCREASYAAGLSVIAEGDAARDLYVVGEGKVMVEMNLSAYPGMVQDAIIENIPPGEPFGWSAVVGSRVYTMTARCLEATRVVAIDGEQLLDLFNRNPVVGFKVTGGLVEVVSHRVRSVIRTAFH
ncbi:MAG: cyclic nucleotide-binding domain-containing protein [Chloroflexota bacterium]|nr:cyclic nucleotide-binding domain-containing protein [Chloroflexota bacterium]